MRNYNYYYNSNKLMMQMYSCIVLYKQCYSHYCNLNCSYCRNLNYSYYHNLNYSYYHNLSYNHSYSYWSMFLRNHFYMKKYKKNRYNHYCHLLLYPMPLLIHRHHKIQERQT